MFSPLNPNMSVTLGLVLLLHWPPSPPPHPPSPLPGYIQSPQLFSDHDFKCPSASSSPCHPSLPAPFAQIPKRCLGLVTVSRWRPWSPPALEQALGAQSDLPDLWPPEKADLCWPTASTRPLCAQMWQMLSGAVPLFLILVYIFTFLTREPSKWEGPIFFPPCLFLTVFQWKPMCLVWPPPSLFSEWH